MRSGPLKAAPSLSFLGLVVMDELCARAHKSAGTALENNTMKINITATVSHALGHWPRIPALGIRVWRKNRAISPVRSVADH